MRANKSDRRRLFLSFLDLTAFEWKCGILEVVIKRPAHCTEELVNPS